MIKWFLSWLGSLLGGPFAKAAVDAYRAKLSSENTSERITADLAARELDVEQREVEVNSSERIANIGRWYEPAHLMAYIVIAYFGKAILFDKVVGGFWIGAHGGDIFSTDPIKGDLAVWTGMVFAYFLGKRALDGLTAILKK